MIKVSVALLCVLFSFAASALDEKSCGDVDLRPQMGPLRNQSNAGWCCSFAGADLIGFKLGRRVSAADLALEYNRTGLRKNRLVSSKAAYSGCENVTDVLDLAKQKGICLESDFPSQDLNAGGLVGYFKDIEARQGAFKEFFEGPQPGWKNLWGLFNRGPVESGSCSKNALLPRAAQSGLEVMDVIRIQTESSVSNVVYKLKDERCHRVDAGGIGKIHRLPPPMEMVSSSFGSKDMDELNQQLTNHNPVMIAYDIYMAHTKLPWYHAYGPAYVPGTHAALIVGRKWSKTSNKCEYLIRSSWGGKCAKGMSGCDEDGHLWVPEDRVLKYTMHAAYLD
jgi:hypothetical protein